MPLRLQFPTSPLKHVAAMAISGSHPLIRWQASKMLSSDSLISFTSLLLRSWIRRKSLGLSRGTWILIEQRFWCQSRYIGLILCLIWVPGGFLYQDIPRTMSCGSIGSSRLGRVTWWHGAIDTLLQCEFKSLRRLQVFLNLGFTSAVRGIYITTKTRKNFGRSGVGIDVISKESRARLFSGC